MRFDVFISYSTKDQAIATEVCNFLEEKGGLSCFISSRDIPKGVEWPSAIADALKHSKLFLAVFSNNYNLSSQVNKELTIASKRHLPLLTFKTTDDDFEGTKDYFLSEVNFVPAFPEPQKAFSSLLENIKSLLGTRIQNDQNDETANLTEEEKKEKVDDLKRMRPQTPDEQFALAEKLRNLKEDAHAFRWYKSAADKGHFEAAYRAGRQLYFGTGVSENEPLALQYLSIAANNGISDAQLTLGRCYQSEFAGSDPDLKKAEFWLLKAADQHNIDSYEDLGDFYANEDTPVYDSDKSQQYRKLYFEAVLDEALENEDPELMNTLAVLYALGKGVETSESNALYWYERAAARGSADAHHNLACRYASGTDRIMKDETKAFEHMQKAYMLAPYWACDLADYYLNGTGTEADSQKAFHLYHEAASTYPEPRAYYMLAKCLLEGIGTETDYETGLRFLERASDQEYLKAMIYLADAYYYGNFGLMEDNKIAFSLYQKVLDLDQDNLYVLNQLGEAYLGGWGVESDLEKAESFFSRSSQIGNAFADCMLGDIKKEQGDLESAFKYYQLSAIGGYPGGKINLAECYLKGEGTSPDEFNSAKWYRSAADDGDPIAQNELGEFYRMGVGVFKNYDNAILWYTKAAEQQEKCAMVNLGTMYMDGIGVEQDYEKAIEWFTKVCNLDDPDSSAFLKIGNLYEDGKLGKKDTAQAINWYKKAIEVGSHVAEYYLAKCYEDDEILPDLPSAYEYYCKASNAGVAEAKYRLAKMLLDGRAGHFDAPKAFSLYKDVSEKWISFRKNASSYVIISHDDNGINVTEDKQIEMAKDIYSLSMYELGLCYLNGNGVRKDESEGRKWITIASKLGVDEAGKTLESLKSVVLKQFDING